MSQAEKSLFELSRSGRRAWSLPGLDVPEKDPKQAFKESARDDNHLPELSEVDIARHFTRLSALNPSELCFLSISAPMFDVMMIMVFLKSTRLPKESVMRPSSSI